MSAQSSHAIKTTRKVLMFPLIRVPLLGGLLFLGMGVSNGYMAKYADAPLSALLAVLLMVALALAVYVAFVRLVENRPVSELSLRGVGGEFGAGLLIGFGLYSLCILVLALLGHYRFDGLNAWTITLPFIPMAISSSVFEELLYRGVLFRVAEEYLGSWIALTATAAYFGARHLGNQDATLIGAIFIAFEAGILLTAAYLVTRRLWLSIGLHMAWNFAQAAIYSGTVSGVRMPPGLVRNTISGPDLLTGGMFGVEASVVAFVVGSAAGITLLVMAARRGKLVAPMWSRAH